MKKDEVKDIKFTRTFFFSHFIIAIQTQPKHLTVYGFWGFFKLFLRDFLFNLFLFQLLRGNDVEYLD